MIKDAKSFVFEAVNTSDSNINMEIKKVLSDNLLSKEDINSYTMSVTRLAIPTTNINQLYFTDNEKSNYTCSLRMYSKYLGEYVNYTRSLPNETDGIYYTSKEKILEMINRSLNNCYMQSYENPIITDLDMHPVTSNITTTFTNLNTLSANIPVSTAYNKFAALKLKILSPIVKNSGRSDFQIIRLFIRTHDNNKMYFYVGTIGDLINKCSKGGFEITEDSFTDWVDFNSTKHTSVKAYESFTKLLNNTFTPHVNIGMESDGSAFSITFQYKLELYFSDEDTMPTQSPFISRSGSDKLYLNLQHYYYKNNHQVGFSSFLNKSMNFCNSPKSYISVNGVKIGYINYDSTILEADLSDLMILGQDNANLGKLSNISEIALKSNTLSGISEHIITNVNVPISSNLIQEFVIMKDDIELGNMLLYSESQLVWRCLDVSKILSQSRNIEFQIWANYENGLSKLLTLAPSETWSLRLSFLRN